MATIEVCNACRKNIARTEGVEIRTRSSHGGKSAVLCNLCCATTTVKYRTDQDAYEQYIGAFLDGKGDPTDGR